MQKWMFSYFSQCYVIERDWIFLKMTLSYFCAKSFILLLFISLGDCQSHNAEWMYIVIWINTLYSTTIYFVTQTLDNKCPLCGKIIFLLCKWIHSNWFRLLHYLVKVYVMSAIFCDWLKYHLISSVQNHQNFLNIIQWLLQKARIWPNSPVIYIFGR